MPRRPAEIIRKIPLFLIDAVMKRALKKAGEELVRVVIKKVKGHCFDIFVHTRSVCRALRAPVERTGAVPMPVEFGAGVADP
jgi:hypothetical protein